MWTLVLADRKKLHSEFCYTQDIIVSFSQKQNESTLTSGRYNYLYGKVASWSVNNLKQEKQTCKNKILKCIKRKH